MNENNIKKGWSFCIVASPGKNIYLEKVVDSIQSEFRGQNNFEIIIVGNKPDILNDRIKIVEFKKENFISIGFSKFRLFNAYNKKSLLPFFIKTGAISLKKNLAFKFARFNKICFLHDYVELKRGWKSGFEKFGDDWLVSVNRIIDINGDREKDWILYDHPDLKTKKNDITQCLLPYHLNSKYMYISGAYFCVKHDFFKNNQLNKNLFWGEGEDVEWSLRVRSKTKFSFNPFSSVKFIKQKYNIPKHGKKWQENQIRLESLLKRNNYKIE
jgi:hypothetical protein